MKKIVFIVVVLMVLMSCNSEGQRIREVVDNQFNMDEVYKLDGLSWSFIGIKDGVVYQIILKDIGSVGVKDLYILNPMSRDENGFIVIENKQVFF